MENYSKYQITDMENKVPEIHRLRDSPTKGTWKEAYADSRAQTLQHRGSETPRYRNTETLRHTSSGSQRFRGMQGLGDAQS